MMGAVGAPVIAGIGILLSVIISYNLHCHAQTTVSSDASIDSDIDFETLSLFGVTPEFAEQFRLNLLKAIEAEEKEQNNLRQGEFGGVSGGFFQGGGQSGGAGTGGAGTGGAGAGGAGAGGQEEEEDYDEDGVTMPPGPGAFGILSGLFGIFSGLGTLSPSRIVQSTVNFFPPGQRQMAQMIVDSLIGYKPPENRTARPGRPRPRATTTRLPLNEAANQEDASVANATVVSVMNGVFVGKDAENSAQATNGTVDGMAALEISTSPGSVNLNESSSAASKPANEDDEEDVEKKYATLKPISSPASSYKLKVTAAPSSVTV